MLHDSHPAKGEVKISLCVRELRKKREELNEQLQSVVPSSFDSRKDVAFKLGEGADGVVLRSSSSYVSLVDPVEGKGETRQKWARIATQKRADEPWSPRDR